MHAKIINRRIKAEKNVAIRPKKIQFRKYQVEQWKIFLEEARLFKKTHGHCVISKKSKATPELARWAKRQRYQYKQYNQYLSGVRPEGKQLCSMTPERIAALNEIGFCWDAHEVIWEERFNELKEFGKVHGHFNVPAGRNRNDPLATWVRQQRYEYRLWKQGKCHSITSGRVEKLTAIGFSWEALVMKKRI